MTPRAARQDRRADPDHFGRHDILTSTRFADSFTQGIANTELHVFETCAHAAIYETVSDFNEKTEISQAPRRVSARRLGPNPS